MRNYLISSLIILTIFFGLYLFVKDVKPSGIVKTEPEIEDFSKSYESLIYKFSIYVPKKYSINEEYTYTPNPNREIKGVSFGIEEEDYRGTNLSRDSYISVESISDIDIPCSVESFLYNVNDYGVIEEYNNHIYSVARSTGAAAGNIYDEVVYVTPVNNTCMAIRYFVHYTNFENYPEGSVIQFDNYKLTEKFDAIRKSIKYQD